MSSRWVAAGGGFLVAVLWFDLMFDVQVFGRPQGPLPEQVLASIAGYYARVTTAAHPMGRLVGIVMLAVLAGTVWQLVRRVLPWRLGVVALGLCATPVGLAAMRIVPNAVRLGTRADTPAVQSELARSIAIEHVVCLVLMLAFTALQIRGAPRR